MNDFAIEIHGIDKLIERYAHSYGSNSDFEAGMRTGMLCFNTEFGPRLMTRLNM